MCGVLPSSPLFHCRFSSSGLQEDFPPSLFWLGAISAAHFRLVQPAAQKKRRASHYYFEISSLAQRYDRSRRSQYLARLLSISPRFESRSARAEIVSARDLLRTSGTTSRMCASGHGRQVLDADLVRVMQHDLPNRRRAKRRSRHLVVLAHRPKYFPLGDLRRDGPEIEPVP
jgi:hypothetical protein